MGTFFASIPQAILIHLIFLSSLNTFSNFHYLALLWYSGFRISGDAVYNVTTEYAFKFSLHNPGRRLNEKFTSHCFRHFFTTMILRSGCPREYVQELRGDIRTEAIDIYHHIPVEELKEAYMKYVFKFGIK